MRKKFGKISVVLLLVVAMFVSLMACQQKDAQTVSTAEETTAQVTEESYYEVNLHFHYVRTDGDYEPWDVWMWTTGEGKAYAFTEEADDNGVALTTTFEAGTQTIGYIVRQQDWTKDVGEDQFIDVSSIYGGTVEVYVTSGVAGARVEFQSDCKYKSETATTQTAQETNESPTHDTSNWAEYAYVQDLNIVEDNYRNYYEIFVYSFYDTDGDGIGDFNGITEKLDYIQDMGFNALWLMPIMPAPSYHKYDTTDYKDVDAAYGTLEDFQNLLKEAHARNITVTIDFVINHTSNQHEWFRTAVEYLKALPSDVEPDLNECPYVDYYHFSKEKKGTNIAGTDWYYESEFSETQPDLNLANENLRKELEEVCKFWVEMGVDGFRMDAALHFEEADTEFNTEVLNWIYTTCCQYNKDFYMVSEIWANRTTIATYYASGTPSMFNFDTSSTDGVIEKTVKGQLSATDYVERLQEYVTLFSSYNENYIDAVFITNHDQVRVCNNLTSNENQMKLAAGLLLTMNGSPYVYYGEEIGMKSSGSTDENKRIGMVWSDTDLTGMCRGPQNADSFEQKFAAVDVQLADEGSILNYYKRALRIRNENPEIARGKLQIVEGLCDDKLAAVTKEYNGSKIGIVYNVSEEELVMDLSGTELASMNIRGYLTVDGSVITLENGQLTLPAQSVCVLK